MASLISQMRQGGATQTPMPRQQQMPQQSQNDIILQQIRNAAKMLQNSQNPATLQNAILSNPNLKQVMNLMKMNNGNSMQVLTMLANQRGLDISTLLNAMQGK